jgi:hypothetical protein
LKGSIAFKLESETGGKVDSVIHQRRERMKRATVGMIATAVLAVATMAFAQAKPDFSGTWAPDAAAAPAAPAGTGGGAAPGGGGGGGGRGMAGPMTIKQTADSLSIEREGRNGKMTTTYKLDGTETEVPMGQATAKATAKWDGSKLVITTKTDQGEQVQTLSLEGGTLTIDRTGGRGPSKTTYKKST